MAISKLVESKQEETGMKESDINLLKSAKRGRPRWLLKAEYKDYKHNSWCPDFEEVFADEIEAREVATEYLANTPTGRHRVHIVKVTEVHTISN